MPYTIAGKTINVFIGPYTFSGGFGLASGLGGKLWYGLNDNSVYYFATMTTGGAVATAKVAAGVLPFGVVESADKSHMWYTEIDGTSQYASVTATFSVTQFQLPNNASPRQITVGADKRLYLGTTGQIFAIAPATGKPTPYAMPNANDLEAGVVLGPDGNVWYAQNSGNSSATVGFVTTTGKTKDFALAGQASGIAVGSNKKIWFGSATQSAVYSVSTSGTGVTQYTAGISGIPQQMVEGPDGNIYFSEYVPSTTQGAVAQITVGGKVTEYALPYGFVPYGIAVGPDGNIWVLDETHDQLGQLVLPKKG